jgi:hypothetical protein
LIDLAGLGGQLDEQVQTGLAVAADIQLVPRMLGGSMPTAIRPEPMD